MILSRTQEEHYLIISVYVMDVTETSYIKSNGIYSLPGVSHRRFIVIPVLFAIGQGKLKNTQSAKMNIMNIKTGHLLSFFGVVFLAQQQPERCSQHLVMRIHMEVMCTLQMGI